MEIINFEFSSEWFKSAYYVYVLMVQHKTKGFFFYIGQTGDKKYTSARSPFYRLWGHFNPYNSKSGTDNQIIKGLLKYGLIIKEDKQSLRYVIDKAFENNDISFSAKYFKIFDFDNKGHKSKRLEVEMIEKHLIYLFDFNNERVFNTVETIDEIAVNKKALEIFSLYNK